MGKAKVLFLSSYPPRECGIATFTSNLAEELKKKFWHTLDVAVVAVNEDESSLHKYPPKVCLTLTEGNLESYSRAAARINSMKGVGVVNIQHEFGLFGGQYGSHLLTLMERLDKKIITTLHTVLENPDERMKGVVQEVFRLSHAVVVMTEAAKKILVQEYGAPPDKISILPHGVPTIKFGRHEESKRKYGLAGNKVLLTFGMLSRGKGIEKVIEALPAVVKVHPDVVYLVMGGTHPKVRLQEGETYRQELIQLARKHGVQKHVKFLNKFVSSEEIVECLGMADVYLAPSLDRRQICSGTVSYALSAGKAIVASCNKYNEEVLGEGRGVIIEDNSPSGFSHAITNMLGNHSFRKALERNAYEFSRKMTWQNVSTGYLNLFSRLSGQWADAFSRLPRLSFRHLQRMTDGFGIIQFAKYSEPDIESGYSLDDNARALALTVKGYEKVRSGRLLRLTETYLSFIENAQMPDGMFHNMYSPSRETMDDVGSEDSYGRTVSALGDAISSAALPESMRLRAKRVFEKSIENEPEINSLRAQANTLMGLVDSLDYTKQNGMKDHIIESLVSSYDHHSDEEWKWFESSLTYANSNIPEALFEAHQIDNSGRALEIAKESMHFLTQTMFIDGILIPIGQENWYHRNLERSKYDQQPIEAAGMTMAYLKAYEKTGQTEYLEKAKASFDWFSGRNSEGLVLYDESTGGCFDGLTRGGVNANQGAESAISYLTARLSIQNGNGG